MSAISCSLKNEVLPKDPANKEASWLSCDLRNMFHQKYSIHVPHSNQKDGAPWQKHKPAAIHALHANSHEVLVNIPSGVICQAGDVVNNQPRATDPFSLSPPFFARL